MNKAKQDAANRSSVERALTQLEVAEGKARLALEHLFPSGCLVYFTYCSNQLSPSCGVVGEYCHTRPGYVMVLPSGKQKFKHVHWKLNNVHRVY